MKRLAAVSVLAMLLTLATHATAAPTYSETVPIYEILYQTTSTEAVWQHTYDGSADPIAGATLTIVAEGVDSPGPGAGELDAVWFAGHFLGYLQQQGFYYGGLEINAGPGALGAPQTALTTSVFTLDPSWITPNMTASVVVAPSWIVEVETATLTVTPIPAPGAILLGATGTGLVGWLRRRRAL